MLKVLFVRHAEAEDSDHGVPGKDAKRQLTKKGRSQAIVLGKALRKLQIKPDIVLSSPLVRAVQTAQGVCRALKSKGAITRTSSLAPGSTLADLKKVLRTLLDRIAGDSPEVCVFIVGHQPDLSQMVSAALRGKPAEFDLKKGACIGLTWENITLSGAPTMYFAMDVKLAEKIRKL